MRTTIGFFIGIIFMIIIGMSIFREVIFTEINGKIFLSFRSGCGHSFEKYGIKDGQLYSIGDKIKILNEIEVIK